MPQLLPEPAHRMNIPKVLPWPAGAVQCNGCGGHGCAYCCQRGWVKNASHPHARKCYSDTCNNPIPPNQVAVYCTNECAFDDA